MNLKRFYIIVLVYMVFVSSNLLAQYQIVLKNDTMITDRQYEFEVFIKSQAGKINLTAYQIILNLNDSIARGSTISFNYIQNSSQLTNVPDVNIGIVEDSTINLAAGSDQGTDTISTEYLRIGRFRISSANSFGNYKTDIGWDFNGFVKSSININDTSKTIKANFINLLKNPLSIKTDVAVNNNSPLKFELYQNFPNPFNPSTQIEFSLPEGSKVSLNVYNLIGQQIADLVDESLGAGLHKVTFNAENLPSGIYIYELRANNYVKTKKMTFKIRS